MFPQRLTLVWSAVACVAMALCSLAPSVAAQDQGTAPPRKAKVPKVMLSDQHKQMVKVQVGDAFPEASLPATGGGDPRELGTLEGAKATVVAVVGKEGAMAKAMLRDVAFDIAKQYPPASGDDKPAVATIAIATGMEQDAAASLAQQVGYEGMMLVDGDGATMKDLGTERMPRVYVLDADGKIAWFDIEYSLSTRREMKQAVAALAKK